MADDKKEQQEQEPERMDAPNQQAVGQPPPWEEGTGGKEGDPLAQVEEIEPGEDPAGKDAESQQDAAEETPKPKRSGGAKK